MFLIAITASAAPLDIVLDGEIYAGSIEGVSMVGEPVRTVLTVDDSVVANEFGVFDYTAESPVLTVDIPAIGETLVLDDDYDLLAAAFSGNGFVVNQGVYGSDLGFALAEDYVVEPSVDFADSTLSPFGGWALDEGGNGQINAQANFTGETTGHPYSATPFAGAADLRIEFRRVYVQETGFYEDTIDASYGSDVIDEGFGYNRRPSTIDTRLRAMDAELTEAGCFVDMGTPFAGAFNGPVRSGEGMFDEVVDLSNTGGRTFAGTIDGNAVVGVQNRKGKVAATNGLGDYVTGFYSRVAGKRGVWYGVTVTGCSEADIEPWFGGSLAAID